MNSTLLKRIKEFLAPYVFDLFIWLSPFETDEKFFDYWCPIVKQNKEHNN